MPKDFAALYHQIGRLLESPPDLSTYQACAAPNAVQWLGKGHALVQSVGVGGSYDAAAYTAAMSRMSTANWASGVREVFQILYRALGHCELHLPAAGQGAFVPVGNAFDAFAALSKIMATASIDVLIVDPYLDHSALTDFGSAVPEGVPIRLLADVDMHKQTLLPAAERWVAQYGDQRPLEVRAAPAKSLHDRAIFIDRRDAWTITQSLKDFAKRSPGEIVRADSIASLKIAAYEAIWATAKERLNNAPAAPRD